MKRTSITRLINEAEFVVKHIRRSHASGMSVDLKIVVGHRVRAARKRVGLTQEGLASTINRTPESVSNIERGLQLPSIDTLVDLGIALGIPIADFFEASGQSDLTSRRLQLEADWRELGRALSEHDLIIAAAQARILLSASTKKLADG